MVMIFHFKDLTAKPNPGTHTFYVRLDRIKSTDNPVIAQLGEVQASMMSVRLRRPVICYGVTFPELPATEDGPAGEFREVKTWQQLVHAWS